MGVADYERFPSYWDDARFRKWNLWSYIDGRDVALACRLGLEAPLEAADHFIVAAADTVMTRPSGDLMAEVFPEVPYTAGGEHESLLSSAKAGRVLGYVPQHSWRDHVSG